MFKQRSRVCKTVLAINNPNCNGVFDGDKEKLNLIR